MAEDSNVISAHHALAVQMAMDWCDQRRDEMWAEILAFVGDDPDRQRQIGLYQTIFEMVQDATAKNYALSEVVVAMTMALRQFVMIGNEIPATVGLVRKLVDDLLGADHWPGGPIY